MNIDLAKDRRAQERPSDALDGNIPVKLTREELRDLSALSPPRSTFHILAEWTLIFTAISSLPTPLQSRYVRVDCCIHWSAAARAAHPDA